MSWQTIDDMHKKTSQEAKFTENPFFMAVLIFFIVFPVGYLLETQIAKQVIDWFLYYFDYIFFWLISTINSFFATKFEWSGLLNQDFYFLIKPWLYLRVYFISAAVIGFFITLLQRSRIKAKNIIFTVILTGFFSLLYKAMPLYSMNNSYEIYISFLQENCIKIIAEMMVVYASLLLLTEFTAYLINLSAKKENIKIKYVSEDRWNPN